MCLVLKLKTSVELIIVRLIKCQHWQPTLFTSEHITDMICCFPVELMVTQSAWCYIQPSFFRKRDFYISLHFPVAHSWQPNFNSGVAVLVFKTCNTWPLGSCACTTAVAPHIAKRGLYVYRYEYVHSPSLFSMSLSDSILHMCRKFSTKLYGAWNALTTFSSAPDANLYRDKTARQFIS